jgi:heme A synthase
MLISIIFTVLLIYPAIGQKQPAKYIESDAGENLPFDVKLEDIERNISSENIPGELVIKSRSMTEMYLSLGVLVFGLILVIFTVILALRKSTGWDQESTRIFTISLVVTAGLFLITAGYSDQQIAPMFGLLGTIVGYLLGKSPPSEQSPKSGT